MVVPGQLKSTEKCKKTMDTLHEKWLVQCSIMIIILFCIKY